MLSHRTPFHAQQSSPLDQEESLSEPSLTPCLKSSNADRSFPLQLSFVFAPQMPLCNVIANSKSSKTKNCDIVKQTMVDYKNSMWWVCACWWLSLYEALKLLNIQWRVSCINYSTMLVTYHFPVSTDDVIKIDSGSQSNSSLTKSWWYLN